MTTFGASPDIRNKRGCSVYDIADPLLTCAHLPQLQAQQRLL
jgi:hypothetical protein